MIATETAPTAGMSAAGVAGSPLLADLLAARFPSLHREGDAPPTVEDPQPGDQVPAGEECPGCGLMMLSWIYNPFVTRSLNGWVLHRARICDCPQSDPRWRASDAVTSRSPAGPTFEPLWLRGEFLQRDTERQTFAVFRESPPLAALLAAAQAAARRPAEGPALFLAGPPSIGKGHLVSAIVNAARRMRIAALSLTATLLLDRSLSTEKDEEEKEACVLRRKALRAVPVLAIRDLFRQPLLPTEVKELDLLLDYRAGRGLITHFTSPYSFAQLHVLPGQTDARAALVRRIEHLTAREVIAPPRTPPFTERMARAAGARP